MEVMSMLLLCAFVATLPQTLGVSRVINNDSRYNSSIWIANTLRSRRHRVLNVNAPPLVNVITELQAAFKDQRCQPCIDCMEWALRAQEKRSYIISRQYPDNLYYDVKRENFQVNNKFKRSITDQTKNNTVTDINITNRTVNNVTVTKYTNVHGKVYAIKISELNKQTKNSKNYSKPTCKIYSVKKTLSCGTRKSDLILTKSKVNKKTKKQKDVSTTTQKSISVASKKPNVDGSHVPPEGFMPSIEEFY